MAGLGATLKTQIQQQQKQRQQKQQQQQKAAKEAKEQDRKVNIVNTTPVSKPTGQQTVQAKKQGDIPSSKPAAASKPATASTSTASSTTAPKSTENTGNGSKSSGSSRSSGRSSGGSGNTGVNTATTGAGLSLAVNNLLKNAATITKPVLPKATTTVNKYGTTGSMSVPKPTNKDTVQAGKLGDIDSGASTTDILRRLTTQTSSTKSKKNKDKKDKVNPKDVDGVQVAAATAAPAKPTDYGADVNAAIQDKWSSQGRSRNYKDASGNVTSALWENNDRNMIDRLRSTAPRTSLEELLNNIGNKSSGSSVPSDVENYLVNTTPTGTTPYIPTTPTPTSDNTKPEWLELAELLDQQRQPTVEEVNPGAYTDYLNGFLPEGYNFDYRNRLGEYAQALDNAEADWRNNLGTWANTLTDTLANNRLNMLNALRQNRASGWTSGAHASADAGGLAQAAGTTAQAANEPMNTLTQEQLKYLATLATKRSDLPGTVASELLGWGNSAAQASAQERGYSMYGREAADINAAAQAIYQDFVERMYPEYLNILKQQAR